MLPRDHLPLPPVQGGRLITGPRPRHEGGTGWLRRLSVAALVAAKAVTFAFSLDPLRDPKQPKFHGKAMRIRVLGYYGVMLAAPLAWLARGRRDPYPVGADLALSVPLVLDAGGNSLGMYDEKNIDDVVHFLNAVIIMTGFGAAISPHVPSRWEAAVITAGTGSIGTTGWEVMEFVAERVGGFRGMDLTYEDTMTDTIESFAGSLVAAVITWARWSPRPGGDAPHSSADPAAAPEPAHS